MQEPLITPPSAPGPAAEPGLSELTFRAVASGLLVGCLIGASNVTIGLKIGWTFGASITAAVLAFAFFKGFEGVLRRPYGVKENLITATAGSSAGTMASAGGMTACIPALEMIRAEQGLAPLSYGTLALWAISIAFLGVFFAVPLRRQMVVVEKLRYPTGTAAAETIKAMYASGLEAMKKARVLMYSAAAAGLIKLILSIKPLGLGGLTDLGFEDIGLAGLGILGATFASLHIGLNLSPMMLGAGILVGPRVGWSLLAGSILAWGIIAPILLHQGIVTSPDAAGVYRNAFKWVLWPGVAMMITAGFTSLALQYKTIGATFKSLRGATKSAAAEGAEEDAPDPFPMKWWLVGMTLATAATSILAQIFFGIPLWMGVLAVVLSLFIASIAVRATGETDINPVGAMGKITQVVYGALHPGMITTNLMTAGITSAGASQSGDLMHDLKAGYLLKVSIRKQVIAQIIGVVAGVFATAWVYRLLTAAYEIPGDEFTGPAAIAWYTMAKVLVEGVRSLPAGALWAALAGGILGVVVTLLGKVKSKAVKRWLPSPVAFGIAFMVPAVYSIAMWFGAFVTALVNRKNPDMVDRFGASMASGLIAGEGLMMVVIAILLILGVSWV
ncbi:MAG: OPT family oligopeptide transporter [Candidatus Zixiibacteriota bacterium]|nr:MAG: OPT family oligopeptide transporter [candidate division Zixibacteria bacterium]